MAFLRMLQAHPGTIGPGRLVVVVALLCVFSLPHNAAAQAPLRLVNDDTQVRKISFRFADTQTLTETQLKNQIALTEPSFFDKVRGFIPLFSGRPHPFDPVILQQDVARLRQYYRQQGFLHTDVNYAASQLDTTDNRIHVIFTIEEGPPVIIQDVAFFAPDSTSYAITQFTGETRDAWVDFRDRNTFDVGERFTEFKFLSIQSDVTRWLRNQGFAFPQVEGDSTLSAAMNTADIQFFVDPGPRGYIAEINVEGNESVSDDVVLRELPFQVGDQFSGRALARGEQQLFSLNLFRLALVEVPQDQPRDSTVNVTVRVQEASLRYVTAQTGYAREAGIILQGRWTHRNFLGGARNLTARTAWNSGYVALPSRTWASGQAARQFQASLALRQPYLFSPNLSGIVSPFYIYEDNPIVSGSEAGINTTLIYELLPFRTVTLDHNFSRASVDARSLLRNRASDAGTGTRDLFDKSIFSVTATLGRADDFLSPSDGFILRPFTEFAGRLMGSSIEYSKAGGEASFYRPFSDRLNVAARLAGGRLLLLGESRYNELEVFNEAGHAVRNGILESRFDRIRFYAGGGSDVRGWAPRMLGPKIAHADTLYETDDDDELRRDAAGNFIPVRDDQGRIEFTNYRYEWLGGLTKIAGNVEARFPFPQLGPAWGLATFLDFGQVSEGNLPLTNLRFGTGAGIRYQTPVGNIRLDLAFKINPSRTDLVNPRELYLHNIGRLPEPEPSFWQRFRIHLNIGQSF